MRRRQPRAGPLALAAVLLAASPAGPAAGSDFFGPSDGLQLQPEIQAIWNASDAFRVIGKIEPTWTPSAGNYVLGYSIHGGWLVAPLANPWLVSPDLAKRRRLDVRVGVAWFPTAVAGDEAWSNIVRLEAEATVRESIPHVLLATWRNRVEAQWQLDSPTGFIWRFRMRPQVEREFVLSRDERTSLTPYVNVEFIWTTAQDMWAQFRMQAGLQWGVNWFGAGQVIELNGEVITNLQPSRSYSPVIGFVWYQYF